MEPVQNEGKALVATVAGEHYQRLPIKTKLITDKDDIVAVAREAAAARLAPGDVFFISEKAVACSQGRAIPMEDIKPRRLARFLVKFVYKSPYGIGLGIPETMEMALRECGVFRILFAAFLSAIGKLFRRRGWFYKIAGYKARSIDGPCPNTIPPYNHYVVLGPKDPDKVAASVSAALGCPCLIVDINDLDGVILGASDKSLDRALYAKILKDNPLGQDCQQTPMGIIRKTDAPEASPDTEKACKPEPSPDAGEAGKPEPSADAGEAGEPKTSFSSESSDMSAASLSSESPDVSAALSSSEPPDVSAASSSTESMRVSGKKHL